MADQHYESPETRDLEIKPVKVARPGSQAAHPRTVANLKRDRKRYNAITMAVAEGQTLRHVASEHHISMNTLQALLASHPELQQLQKERQASLFRFASIAAAQGYLDDLEAGLIKPEAKPVHAAVFADKAQAAAGEASVIVRHESGPTPEELLKKARAALQTESIDIKAKATLEKSQVTDNQVDDSNRI